MGCQGSKNDSDGRLSAKEEQKESRSRRASQHISENMVHEEFLKDIHKFYDISKKSAILGTGISGAVRVGIHKVTHREFAIKRLDKSKITTAAKLTQTREEIRIMAKLDHPNILRLHECFETPTEIYLVLDLCRGGELLDRLERQAGHHYSELVACRYVHAILGAVHYCHQHHIIHRDLKLENLLFENVEDNSDLKLIDFGLSATLMDGEKCHTAVGTPYYIAPEVIQGNYDAKCDVWSIGVIAYMLASGDPPFAGRTDAETLQSVATGYFEFDYTFDTMTVELREFISMCLDLNVEKRPTAAQALQHPWFKMLEETEQPVTAGDSQKMNNILNRLRKFEKYTALKKVCMEVVAHTLSSDQVTDLKDHFLQFDPHHTGEITHASLQHILENNGGFSVEDMEHIFNGVNVEHDGSIKYNEFIAATLSRQSITEENLQVAFEKMSNHNAYITPSDLKDLIGADGDGEVVENMLQEMNLTKSAKISYKQFKGIMKGGEQSSMVTSPSYQFRNSIAFYKKNKDTLEESLSTESTLLCTDSTVGALEHSVMDSHGHLATEETSTDISMVELNMY